MNTRHTGGKKAEAERPSGWLIWARFGRMPKVHSVNLVVILALVAGTGLAACSSPESGAGFSYREMPVATESVGAGEGNSVTMGGSPLALTGAGIRPGEALRNANLARGDLSLIDVADTKGKVRIISVVPSLDTPVCEQQTHYLSEKNGGLDESVELITVSVDTPFAQVRFAREAAIENVTFLSDYRDAAFGRAHGLLVEGPHFLARAVLVVDADNVVRYLQVNDELAAMPDMEAAFRVARSLVGPR